jgi:hypothetical protein
VYLNRNKTNLKMLNKNISYNLALNRPVKPQNHEEFGYWLAGLIDVFTPLQRKRGKGKTGPASKEARADGHINKKDGRLVIDCHRRDLGVAYYITKVIGSGSIYKYKKVSACRYCSIKQSQIRLSHLLLNKLCLPRKIVQLKERFGHGVGSKLCQTNDSPVSTQNHWFTGFVQGDGSFIIRIRKPF